ncbi:MAG TPA: toluene-4-monooxygenase system B family protein [Polyangiaceae bacterium]|nr:toluene-4-monooxygenase system B family protein [Polyangiaceae bacterium]
MAIPLYAFVRGDTLGLVVLAPEAERVDELALRLSRAAAPRVALCGPLRVLFGGRPLRGDLTLTEAGLAALDHVELVMERELA